VPLPSDQEGLKGRCGVNRFHLKIILGTRKKNKNIQEAGGHEWLNDENPGSRRPGYKNVKKMLGPTGLLKKR